MPKWILLIFLALLTLPSGCKRELPPLTRLKIEQQWIHEKTLRYRVDRRPRVNERRPIGTHNFIGFAFEEIYVDGLGGKRSVLMVHDHTGKELGMISNEGLASKWMHDEFHKQKKLVDLGTFTWAEGLRQIFGSGQRLELIRDRSIAYNKRYED